MGAAALVPPGAGGASWPNALIHPVIPRADSTPCPSRQPLALPDRTAERSRS